MIVLSLQTKNENGEGAYLINWFTSNMRVSEMVALLEAAKSEMTTILTGRNN